MDHGGLPRTDSSDGGQATAADRLREVGEFGLIERIARVVHAGAPPAGPGDDAAVVPAPDGRLVATTDLLVEGRHFRLDWSTPYDVGRKAAAQNLADVAAMGGRGTSLLVGLAAPADTPAALAEQLAAGLADECALVGAAVVGGDVVAADQLALAITALGALDGREPVLRSGARPGDVVVAVGRLGWAATGLRLLGDRHREGPFVAAHRRPEPPYAAGPRLAAAGATSLIDVSDGLVGDLGHVAQGSGVGIELELAALRTLAHPDVRDEEVLTGGDDHALVATLPPETPVPDGMVAVGRVVAGSGVRVDGEVVRGGWQHFG